jgi:hypothetical protein
VVFSLSVLEAGNTVEVIDRADLINEWDHLQRLTRNVTSTLRATGANTRMPSRASESLKPFFSYLERCTTAEDQLLVGGYLVELPFIARRRFAAGQQYFGGSFVGTPDAETHYMLMGATSMDGGGEVRILVDSRIPPAGDDAATGWPCFLSRARDNWRRQTRAAGIRARRGRRHARRPCPCRARPGPALRWSLDAL